jgi:protein tyrosine phosphatase (PTP) superfamily phosphohydrolase (DUF442 family)
MSTPGPRAAIKLGFAAVLVVGLLAFGRIALPFSVSTGPLALNYVENSPGISSAGMPTRRQFAAISEAGFRVVVNLAPPGSLGGHEDEQALVERNGMRYFSVPMDFDAPRAGDYERFAAILRQHRDERVLVHCQLSLRASTMVFLYRVIELGEDPDQAFGDVVRVWQPGAEWQKFMREILVARGSRLPMELDA